LKGLSIMEKSEEALILNISTRWLENKLNLMQKSLGLWLMCIARLGNLIKQFPFEANAG
jgi:hypothetical protein